MLRKNTQGFSLIELMIVVVIIGILAAIAIPNYIAMQNRAKEGSVKGNAHAVQLAVEDYAVTNAGDYPDDNTQILATMFPGGAFPNNPFTGDPITVGAAGAFVQGTCGYEEDGSGVYTIEGYGYDDAAGPGADGTVISLSNG